MIAATRRSTALASAALLGSAAAWGSATVLTKDVLTLVPPLTLLVLQLSACVDAIAMAIPLQGRLPRWYAETQTAGRTGLLEPGLAHAVGVPGLTLTPVFGVGGGVLFLGETVAPVQAAGAVLILLAIVTVRPRAA